MELQDAQDGGSTPHSDPADTPQAVTFDDVILEAGGSLSIGVRVVYRDATTPPLSPHSPNWGVYRLNG